VDSSDDKEAETLHQMLCELDKRVIDTKVSGMVWSQKHFLGSIRTRTIFAVFNGKIGRSKTFEKK